MIARTLTSAECQCAACGHVFSSLSGFDLHQQRGGDRNDHAWDGRCLNPYTAVDKHDRFMFEQRKRAGGLTWVLASHGEFDHKTLAH